MSPTVYYLFDPQGSVASRLNGSQTVLSSDQYDAYGNRWQGDTTDVFAYGAQTGYYRDSETGLYLCTFRYYDPRDGRFLTRDPMGYGGGVNLYGYVANNAITRTDPQGTFFWITGAAGAVVGGVIGGAAAALQGGTLGDVLAGAGKGTLLGGIAGLTGGAAGGLVAGLSGGGVVGGVLGGAAGGAAGDAASQGVSMVLGWQQGYYPEQTAIMAGTGALFGSVFWRPTTAGSQEVTRWGAPGPWVMIGGASWRNWWLSGSPELGYPRGSYTTMTVPGSALRYPRGMQCVKGLIGQRLYRPYGSH